MLQIKIAKALDVIMAAFGAAGEIRNGVMNYKYYQRTIKDIAKLLVSLLGISYLVIIFNIEILARFKFSSLLRVLKV